MSEGLPCVLIHDCSHGRWCWQVMQHHLRHGSLAVDLPGRRERPAELRRLTVSSFAASIIDDMTMAGLDEVVLVGHSVAAVTVLEVARRLGPRCRGMVFVAGTVPVDGGCALDCVSPFVRWAVLRAMRSRDEIVLSPRLAARILCNDLDAAAARAASARMVPDAWGVTTEPIYPSELDPSIPRAYVKLLRDRIVPAPSQDRAITALGAGTTVFEVDGAHDVMLSRPVELASKIDRAVDDFEAQLARCTLAGR